MKILVLLPEGAVRNMFFAPDNRRALEEIGEVVWNSLGRHYTPKELEKALADTDVVVTGWGTPGITGGMLAENGRRRLLAHMGGSVAPYTDRLAFEKGLSVTCANEIFAGSVAEGTLAYILAGLRRIPYWDGTVKSGGWRGDSFCNHSLMGKRVGITGYGAVVRNLLPLLRPFGVEILLSSRHLKQEDYIKLKVTPATLEEIFETCDVISLHNGLNDETAGMADASLLGKIKQDALFVNTARGGLVDEAALADLLEQERFYAVLDVYRMEPLPADARLRGLSHAILMPHMAGPASDVYEVCGKAVAGDIARFARKEKMMYQVEKDMLEYMTAKG